METRRYAAAPRPALNDVGDGIRATMDVQGAAWRMGYDRATGEVVVFFEGDWSQIDESVIVDAIGATAPDDEYSDAVRELARGASGQILVRLLAQLHSTTPAAIRSQVRTIAAQLRAE